jgi:hypothetical protein
LQIMERLSLLFSTRRRRWNKLLSDICVSGLRLWGRRLPEEGTALFNTYYEVHTLSLCHLPFHFMVLSDCFVSL